VQYDFYKLHLIQLEFCDISLNPSHRNIRNGEQHIHLIEISSLCGSHKAALIAWFCDWTEVALSSYVSSPALFAKQSLKDCISRSLISKVMAYIFLGCQVLSQP